MNVIFVIIAKRVSSDVLGGPELKMFFTCSACVFKAPFLLRGYALKL